MVTFGVTGGTEAPPSIASSKGNAPALNTGSKPPMGNAGVVIAIGPIDQEIPGVSTNSIITFWTTFHLTPERIGPKGTALWGANQVVQGANLPNYTGFQANQLTWTGRLEPPRVYLPSAQSGPAELNSEQFLISPQAQTSRNEIGAFGFTAPSDIGGGAGVVMEDGAQAGGFYVEPHTFAALLDEVREAGEVFRLILGDQYGYNQPVHLLDWEWFFEDQDPDVLNYSITVEQHLFDPLFNAASGSSAKGRYAIQNGDSLISIAHKKLGSPSKWRTLVRLNKGALEKFYVHAAPKEKIPYVYSHTQVTPADVRIKTISSSGVGVNPNAHFLAGGSLLLKAPAKKKGTKGKR